MAASASVPGRVLYRGCTAARLWRRAALSVLALAFVGFAAGGCSFSYQLGSLFGKEDEKPPEVTSSIPPKTEKQVTDARFAEGLLPVKVNAGDARIWAPKQD